MKQRTRRLRRALACGAGITLTAAGAAGASGCLTRPIQPIEPLTTSVVTDQFKQSAVNKIDLLLAVDNSASMADKQAVLALAVPDLINGLVNPKCLDDATGAATATQPSGPLESCPPNSTRDFTPVTDIHIGLVSSSLGTFSGSARNVGNWTFSCPDTPLPNTECPTEEPNPVDDHGHLVTRSSTCNTDGPVPTFKNEGFLAWDPNPGAPAGSIGDAGAIGESGTLIGSVHDLVVGNGESGCGFESQDESWYRFLVDPTPYGSITFNGSTTTTSGSDSALITQRAQFLRPDSLLAIIVLSDETDTSIIESSAYPLFGTTDNLWRGSAMCDPANGGGPTNECCYSCGEATPPAGCAADPTCKTSPYFAEGQENPNIRAFGLIEHKQTYGAEFFYPPSRYVNALTSPTIDDAQGVPRANPIFTNLNKTAYPNASVRDPSLVFYAAIVGVPWQLIARKNAQGEPDLVNGIDDTDPTQIGGFKTAAELGEKDGTGAMCSYDGRMAPCTFWDDVSGDPEHYVKARSPFMQESSVPRTGKDPILGLSPAPASTPNGSGAKVGVTSTSNGQPVLVNDHEWTVPSPYGDIQYACIFSLGGTCTSDADCPAGVNCVMASGATTGVCGRDESTGVTGDCLAANNPAGADKPLCSPNPLDPTGARSLQTSAKAYPSLKELAIARGMGSQGIAASICPAQLSDNTKADFGYRPAVTAIITRLKQALRGECLPRQLTENTAPGPDQGQVPCLVLEGTKVADPATDCTCDAPSRQPVPSEQQAAVQQAEQQQTAQTQELNCFCEITQATSSDLVACQTSVTESANGWCYVDAAVSTAQATVLQKTASCPATSPHNIRFMGTGEPASGSTLFITCAGD